ncbi:MAG: MgtC/SapB family protein [Proteobacteria bacterium]|nr:MgtC/SapB family protein [Pseudomonadota bacterium]
MDTSALTFGDIVLRLLCAVACGGVIGLNRDLHHKGAGLRTFGLVALATAGVAIGALTAGSAHPDDFGRVMQGVLTGVGFLGAGVILRRPDSGRVTGLTTAAAIWFVAGVALLCGLGQFLLVGLLVGMALLLLLFGRGVERLTERWLGAAVEDEDASPPPLG